MTRTFNIIGPNTVFGQIMRTIIVAAAAVGGLFVLAASAAFAFFIAAGLLILGALTFVFFWARAKFFGRPLGPKAQFEQARKDMEAQLQGQNVGGDGPIIDAHRTPEGWSVDN